MTSYADVEDDLVPRLPRNLTAAELERAPLLIEDASFWLDVWVPGLADIIAGGDMTVGEAAKLLVVAMVRRALLTPDVGDGVESRTQSAGVYSESIRYRNPDGNLYLYGRELDDLMSLLRSNRADAVSMRSPGL